MWVLRMCVCVLVVALVVEKNEKLQRCEAAM
jgi:hypothetical protein